jgi:hypothetical protein
MIISSANILIVIALKLGVDFKRWKKGKSVNHPLEWLGMAVLCTPAIAELSNTLDIQYYISVPISGGICAFIIWLLFDGLYNILRGEDWWFTGSDDKEDAKTDNLLQKLKLWQHICIKIIPLSVLIFIYIKILA